ncbi:hypothetical protein M409DRAFT_69772 [Zasmidium cellare ATCC 36951]|uniref:ubiquitinyl hydrolase 1 n=1 Tax=Zasmidium cellare ATCC 36951 TaxID=1080233 RepID=A0A6A6C7Q0_ZASCE|nr:uncharacterized protein M409DRAFT_69772 [Zasmidium cellare ATCC 36951]KAF2161416.1 hypothetical protein M409DRAFT_69772 [Zasmidium cellare ATCC 36951]
MDRRIQLESLQDFPKPTITTGLAYGFILLYALHYLLNYLDVPILSPREAIWNAVVYCLPTPLLLDAARRQELQSNGMISQTHAAKSDALRRMLGLGGNAILQKLPSGDAIGMGSIMRRMSTSVAGSKGPHVVTSDAPAGLGNWDNSCYQNSVLQALSSLGSLRDWLSVSEPPDAQSGSTTNSSLQELIGKLRDPTNNGRHIWTPAKLKNMSSWQQQDAQEYFSKIMDELDKEAAKAASVKEEKHGLETLVKETSTEDQHDAVTEKKDMFPRNPLEGLVAQRVACTSCGFSEGYLMIPFNCLTVPLGTKFVYDLEECLDAYTESEDIEGVECRSCTLLHAQKKLRQLELPPELRGQIAQRLKAIEEALEKDDFSDKTLKQECQIPAKQFVSSTKTREAIIGRAPKSLVVHVNRSVFDEMTGMQRKNYAHVQYPLDLDLRPWMLRASRNPSQYRLTAAVTHYGRHENGHYICYRKHPRVEIADDAIEPDDDVYGAVKEGWWRLSDEDVSPVSVHDVEQQGGVFMLFYERIDEPGPPFSTDDGDVAIPATNDIEEAAAIALPPDEEADWEQLGVEQVSTATPSLITSSSQSVVSESDTDVELDGADDGAVDGASKPQQQAPLLKTASPGYMRPTQKDMKHDMSMSRSIMSV